MTQMDLIDQFVGENSNLEDVLKSVRRGEVPGVQAVEIQEAFGILRNNASSMLNYLFKSGKVVKINSRPVTFLSSKTAYCLQEQYGLPFQKVYALSDLQKGLLARQCTSTDPFSSLYGWNGSLKRQVKMAKAAIIYPPTGLHTLLLGASGVGKTSFAKAMHEYGRLTKKQGEKNYPFVTFNCADYCNNPQLLLSQLFGHIKNAFTGAEKDKAGLVEKADGGILFLDEVHRLPPEGQEMLFYLMDEGEYNRLGDSVKKKSNVLVIAATTESPESVLLDTFRRRLPMTIFLPSYEKKPLMEKMAIIENFFRIEAVNLKKPLRICPLVWQKLIASSFARGNVGRLRSEIKLLCASAFYEYVQGAPEIKIEKEMFSDELREIDLPDVIWFGKTPISDFAIVFPQGVKILPQRLKNLYPCPQNSIFHAALSEKLNSTSRSVFAMRPLAEFFSQELEAYFSSIKRYFFGQSKNLESLAVDFLPQQVAAAIALMKAVEKVFPYKNILFFSALSWLAQLQKGLPQARPQGAPSVTMGLFCQKAAAEFPALYELIHDWWQVNEEILGPSDELGISVLSLILGEGKKEALP